jgi:hypothetical protein
VIHNGHVDGVEVTIHLARLFGGFWAFRSFGVEYSGEAFPCTTDAAGNATLRIVPSAGSWAVRVGDKIIGTFAAKSSDFQVNLTF